MGDVLVEKCVEVILLVEGSFVVATLEAEGDVLVFGGLVDGRE